MKKLYITFMLLIIIKIVSAQAILEHTYPDRNVWPYKLTNYGWIYAVIHSGNPKNFVEIYNSNHSLIKTITLSIPSGYQVMAVQNVSDNLFNSDNKIEVLYTVNSQSPFNCNMMLINEDGTLLQQFPGQYFGSIFNMDGDFKMITTGYPTVDSSSSVYALPGTMVGMTELKNDPGCYLPSPNPCNEYILFPPQEESDLLVVWDLSGKNIHFNIQRGQSYRLRTAEIPEGVYIYRLGSKIGKFTVIR